MCESLKTICFTSYRTVEDVNQEELDELIESSRETESAFEKSAIDMQLQQELGALSGMQPEQMQQNQGMMQRASNGNECFQSKIFQLKWRV